MVEPRIARLVRNFVARLPYGKLFVTRELLNLGPRENIDRTLSRLVKENILTRLANGVFAKIKADTRIPSIGEIAAYKAKAFGRRILEAGGTTRNTSFGADPPDRLIYATDGHTSSFRSIWGRIHFKNYAPRKLKLLNTVTGKNIRAIWELGAANLTQRIINRVRHDFGVRNLAVFNSSCAIMPAWMADALVFANPRSRR